MHQAFELISEHGLPWVRQREWQAQGFLHGFTGMAGGGANDEPEKLCRLLGVERLLRLKQVHGRTAVAVTQMVPAHAALADKPAVEADVILVDGRLPAGCAAALSTADCIPLILRSAQGSALVHAGWRGLASGAIESALRALGGGAPLEAAIGPCACRRCYEVGREVIEAIGETSVFEPCTNGKFLLDLPGTAARQIRELAGDRCRVWDCEVCTIEDRAFHSYRRDGSRAGRNLCFLA